MTFLKKYLKRIIPEPVDLLRHWLISVVASILYRFDQNQVKIIGVTGTDGKTTTTYFLDAIFTAAGFKTASVNSIRYKIGDQEWKNDTDNTTPGGLTLKGFLRQAAQQGAQVMIIEATSWGLVQSRLNFINFDAAVLTNLTYEHLDLHKTFENYRQAKLKLFRKTAAATVKPGIQKISSINLDDPAARDFLKIPIGRSVTYGTNSKAELQAQNLTVGTQGISFDLVIPSQNIRKSVNLKLAGEFNVYNALAAAAVAWGWDIPVDKISLGLESVAYIPGRLETIYEGQPFQVIVDFAHTPNGMRQLFRTVRLHYPQGRIIAVYGATGGRDPGKRPLIGQVAAEMVDYSVLTSEDPRNEDPQKIAEEIIVGLKEKGRVESKDFHFVRGRAEAIDQAFKMAQPGDTVLLCSMGCYENMYVGDGKIPWDDRTQARELLRKLLIVKI